MQLKIEINQMIESSELICLQKFRFYTKDFLLKALHQGILFPVS